MLSKLRSIYGNNVLLLKYTSEREREGDRKRICNVFKSTNM